MASFGSCLRFAGFWVRVAQLYYMVIHVDLWICTDGRGVESNSNLGPVKVHMRAVRSVTLRLAKHAAYLESQNLRKP